MSSLAQDRQTDRQTVARAHTLLLQNYICQLDFASASAASAGAASVEYPQLPPLLQSGAKLRKWGARREFTIKVQPVQGAAATSASIGILAS